MMTIGTRRLVQVALGATAGIFAWPLMEVLIITQPRFPGYLFYTVVSGAVFGAIFGAVFGSADGIVANRTRRVVSGALSGLAIGAAGGAAGFLAGQGVLFVAGEYLSSAIRRAEQVAFPLARAAGWAVMGVFIGISPGIRSRSVRKSGIGALGGLVGGIVGGAVIEYGVMLFPTVSLVRAVGLVVFGALVGTAFAIVERFMSFGVLRVLNGRMKGHEYMLNQRSISIGSDDRADVPLPGYREVAAMHANVHVRGRDLVVMPGGGPVVLNDRRHEAGADPIPLKYDDVLGCGSVRFLLRRD